jgi:hypothetical protein
MHWQEEFKRITREKGVSEEKLEELNDTHSKGGPHERLMHALKTLVVGNESTCTPQWRRSWQTKQDSKESLSRRWQHTRKQFPRFPVDGDGECSGSGEHSPCR